jgi:Gpi18-like mannosyltransferase
LALFTPRYSFEYDQQAFNSWCNFIFENGVSEIHSIKNPDFNYSPLICYLFWLFGKCMGSTQNITNNFYLLKVVALGFDFIAAFLIAHMVQEKALQVISFLALAANPIFIYNSYCWGQFDGVLSCLIFLSFLSLLRQNFLWGVVYMVLAINLKLQAIIFLPPLIILALYILYRNQSFYLVIPAFITGIILQIFILLPFILNNKMNEIWHTILGTVGYFPSITHTANNFWWIVLGSEVRGMTDTIKIGFLTYRHAGLLLFATTSFFAMAPLLTVCIKKIYYNKNTVFPLSQMAITFALIPLLFFFFNTQMHERYSHPAFVFVALFSFTQKKYLAFIIMCLAYLGNIEPAVQSFHFPNYGILLFNNLFVACLYALLIVILFYHLYKPQLNS